MNKESISLSFLQNLPGLQQLQEDLAQMGGPNENVCFLCYDIRFLRKINRAYGRKTGDALLAAAAAWAQRLPGGRLYRIEGDEFCLAFLQGDLDRIKGYANNMESRFGRVWHLEVEGGHRDIFAQAAIAVVGALEGDYTTELPDLLEQALELSRTHQQFTVFTAEFDRMTRERARLQMELKNCILSGMQGFTVLYQPIVDAVGNTWRGVEALCRWTGPTIGPVSPNIFIAETEEMGLIHQLGAWVLDTTLGHCKAMHLDEIPQFFLSINVSALQINRRDYVCNVLKALDKHRYPTNKLVLEITESTQFSFNETTSAAIDTLRAKGVMFALDDFGSGYSGFSNLKNLPVDLLKTDREFIEDIENDTYLQYFYYIMSETAHANNMQLIAEGVETQEQLRTVVKSGADLIQGYLFGRPMDRQTMEKNVGNFTAAVEQFTDMMSDLTDLKHWIYGQDAYKITPALFGLQSKCIRTMLDSDDPDQAIQEILETVGAHFKVSRVYVFLRGEGAFFSNKYEWCAEGVAKQMHLFQEVNALEDGFYETLRENEVVIARTVEQLPSNLKYRLELGGQEESIHSMLVMPMKRRGEILGFVGFDDNIQRDWMPEELIILHNLCLFCLIILARKETGLLR